MALSTPAPKPRPSRRNASRLSALLRPRGSTSPPLASRTSAATPAADGVAAEGPKKRHSPWLSVGQVPEPKPPEPLTDTPSAAVQFGALTVFGAGPGRP